MWLRLTFIALLIVFSATSSAPDISAWDGLTHSCEHFDFFYRPQDSPSAKGLVAVAEREYERVADIIGHRPADRIQVYVARDVDDFRLLTMGRIPEWGIGAAVPERSRIVLLSPRQPRGEASLRQVFAHELSHVILGQALKQSRAPRWLDEGLAMFISHEWRLGQSVLVARALLFDSLIPLDDIADVNTYSQTRASLAYAESFLAVAFIVDRFGESSLHQLIRELARYGDMDLAMGISLGMTYGEFQLVWRDYVTRRFNWASIISHPILLWTFILLLFVLVFLLKTWHTRKTLRLWKLAEEGDDDVSLTGASGHRWRDRW